MSALPEHRTYRAMSRAMAAGTCTPLWVYVLWISLVTAGHMDPPIMQLAGLDRRCQGAVQIRMEETWHSLCGTALNHQLSAQICRMQHCGKPIETISGADLNDLNVSSPLLNITCGLMKDLRSCSFSSATEDECGGAAVLNCTAQPVLRLVGSNSGCAGRVEMFQDGAWGSVCHDGWDALDAEVTCRQLMCGSALSAIKGSYFGSGPSQTHLNEVNCTGSEDFLWECPASRKQDCSRGDHAGVICTEHRDVRLSGGANNCSGRMEVYLHGVWATVCDNHWYDDDSSMICRILGCGSFQKITRHEHSLLYVSVLCSKAKSLWDCKIYKKKAHLCGQSKALGLICQAGAVNDSQVTESRTVGCTNDTVAGTPQAYAHSQYLGIGCAAVTALLMAIIFIFSVIIFRQHKKNSRQSVSLPRSNNRWNLQESKEPDFSLRISPLCAAPSPRVQSKEPVAAAIPLVPTMITALEDEEDYGFSSAPPQPLVTFHDSFLNAGKKEPQGAAMAEYGDSNQRRMLRSALSEQSSSTSSEEENWYENYRQQGDFQQNLLFPSQPYEGSSEYDDVSSVASD